MPNLPQNFRANAPSKKKISDARFEYGSSWRKLRNAKIEANPLCEICLPDGLVTVAKEVDHIIPRAAGGKDVWENCQSLCKPCHRIKSANEQKQRSLARQPLDYFG